MTISILIFLYATLTSLALFSARKQLPAWLTFLNILTITMLYLSLVYPLWLAVSLFIAILTAINNGLILNGKVSAYHLIIRIVFSLFIFFLSMA